MRQVSVGGGDRGEVSRKETATARYEGSKSYLK